MSADAASTFDQGAPGDQLDHREFFEELVETGIPAEHATFLEPLLVSKDLVLGKTSKVHTEKLEHFLEAQGKTYTEWMAPNRDGPVGAERAVLCGDPDDKRHPIPYYQYSRYSQAIKNILYRASRSEDGFQQKEMHESFQTIRQEKDDNTESDGGGRLSKWLGRGE